jgi:hypothetical protein
MSRRAAVQATDQQGGLSAIRLRIVKNNGKQRIYNEWNWRFESEFSLARAPGLIRDLPVKNPILNGIRHPGAIVVLPFRH